MAVLREDSFEGYTIGNDPGGSWTITDPTSGGDVSVENDPDTGSPRGKTMRMFDDDTGSTARAELSIPSSKEEICLVLEVRPEQVTKNLVIGVRASAVDYPTLSFRSDAFIKYWNGSAWTDFATAKSYTAVTWVKLRLVIDRNEASELVMVTQDELDLITAALNVGTIAADIDSIYIETVSGEDNSDWYVNDVQVLDRIATISGTVEDDGASAIEDAEVVVVRYPPPSINPVDLPSDGVLGTDTTDVNGDYSIDIDAGVYVAVVAFDPAVVSSGAPAGWMWAR